VIDTLKDLTATVLLVLAFEGCLSPPQAVGAYYRISRMVDSVSAWVGGAAEIVTKAQPQKPQAAPQSGRSTDRKPSDRATTP
jgi:hypothetical protein